MAKIMTKGEKGIKAKQLLNENLPLILCVFLIALFILSFEFYFEPLYEEGITLETYLYKIWASFSAAILALLIVPKQFRVVLIVSLVGGILNATALAANGGYMPVAASSCIYVTGNHIPWYEGVRLPFLCDWVFGVMSIGDLFLGLSLPLVLIVSVRFWKEMNAKL